MTKQEYIQPSDHYPRAMRLKELTNQQANSKNSISDDLTPHPLWMVTDARKKLIEKKLRINLKLSMILRTKMKWRMRMS